MAVFSCSGVFGAGKTAFAVWFARELSARRGGCPVWANFSLKGSKAIYTFDDLYRCEGGVIVLDELQGTIHARRSNHNLTFLKWFDQCRKQDSDVICITQALHKIDVIVREMIECHFECEKAGGTISRITPVDLVRGRERAAFFFDRAWSFDHYDHKERAWALVEFAKDSDAPGVKNGRVPVATAAVAPLRRVTGGRGVSSSPPGRGAYG